MSFYSSPDYYNDCEIWAESSSWYNLCELMNMYIDNKISSPHHARHVGKYDWETPIFLNKLRILNTAGLLTTRFQFGENNGETISKSYIKIHIPTANLNELLNQLNDHNLIAIISGTNIKNLSDVCPDNIYNIGPESSKMIDEVKEIYHRGRQIHGNIMCFPQIQNELEFWGDFKHIKSNRFYIPLQVQNDNKEEVWECKEGITVHHEISLFPELFHKYNWVGYKDILNAIVQDVCGVLIIDRNWNIDPNYIFDTLIDITNDLDITDMDFE